MVWRRSTPGLFALSILVAACSMGAEMFPERVFGVLGGCTPPPSEVTNYVYSPGGVVLEDGQVLSDLDVEITSPTGFSGTIRATVVDDSRLIGFGVEYDESHDLFSSPATVTGPGNAFIVLVVEAGPREDTIIFSNAEFTIDGESFVSSEGDEFELQITEGDC